MDFAIDMAYKSVNHAGEELCGDTVDIISKDDSRIMILTDGMGSGVRANILATLTQKIIATLMKNNMPVDEMVSTIAKTLPISSVNGVAYSTFSVVQIFRDGMVYVVEYDNPDCILIRDGKIKPLPFQYREIEGKKIRECRFQGQMGDCLAIMSDGCLYCGTEDFINYSWDWQAVAECAEIGIRRTNNAQQLANLINQECYDLYGGVPTDDTTVAVARLMEEKIVSILTGPPSDKRLDYRIVEDFLQDPGVKIVSGGSTGKMTARVLNERLVQNDDSLDPDIPPTSRIHGIDLVTEGVVTLNRVVELLEMYLADDVVPFFDAISVENGATRLVCYLIEDCTMVNLYVGKAINMDYSEKTLPFEVTVRQNVLKRLEDVLTRMNLRVNVYYY